MVRVPGSPRRPGGVVALGGLIPPQPERPFGVLGLLRSMTTSLLSVCLSSHARRQIPQGTNPEPTEHAQLAGRPVLGLTACIVHA